MVANLSKTAFWDVDFNKIDFEKNVVFVLEKVFNYGLWNDYIAVIKHYGKDRIRKEIVHAAYFKKKVLPFLCLIFDLQTSDFKCYTRRQSQKQHWNY